MYEPLPGRPLQRTKIKHEAVWELPRTAKCQDKRNVCISFHSCLTSHYQSTKSEIKES